MKEDEDRSLDRMIEVMRRDTAKRRAVMNIKLRLLAEAGIMIRLTHHEHHLIASDYREWAKTETEPVRKARLVRLGNLSEALGRAAFKKVVEAEEAKKAKNARRRARRKARKASEPATKRPRRPRK